MPDTIVLTQAQRDCLHMLSPRGADVLLARLHEHGGLIVSLNDVAFALSPEGHVSGLLLEEEQFIFSERRARALPPETSPTASVTHIHSLTGGNEAS